MIPAKIELWRQDHALVPPDWLYVFAAAKEGALVLGGA